MYHPVFVHLLPKLTYWVNSTSQTMGNWTPKEWMQQELSAQKIQPAEVSVGNIPLKLANEILQNNRELVVIGFDALQIPIYKIVFRLDKMASPVFNKLPELE